MSKKGRWGQIKRSAEIRSVAKGKQSNAVKLQKKLKKLTDEAIWTEALKREVNDIRFEYSRKQRELGGLYMEKEIVILEDIKLQLQK